MNWKKLGLLSVLAGSLALSSGVVSEVGAQGTDQEGYTEAQLKVVDGDLKFTAGINPINFEEQAFTYDLFRSGTQLEATPSGNISVIDDRNSAETIEWNLSAFLTGFDKLGNGNVTLSLTGGRLNDGEPGFPAPSGDISVLTFTNDNTSQPILSASRTKPYLTGADLTGAGSWNLTFEGATLDIAENSLAAGEHEGKITWVLGSGPGTNPNQ